jgi:hypothetical protein
LGQKQTVRNDVLLRRHGRFFDERRYLARVQKTSPIKLWSSTDPAK